MQTVTSAGVTRWSNGTCCSSNPQVFLASDFLSVLPEASFEALGDLRTAMRSASHKLQPKFRMKLQPQNGHTAKGTHHHGCPRICWTDVLPDVHAPQDSISRLEDAVPNAREQVNDTAHESDVHTVTVMAARQCYCWLRAT